MQGDDPLILTLARGHYCPKEHQQHLELAAFYPKIAVAYTQIATISTDAHHTLQEFRASVGAQWPFLSDPERIVQKDLDIQEYTDPEQRPDDPAHARAEARAGRSTASTTATGSGAARRSSTSGTTCATSRARSAPTGTSARRGCATPGTRATARPSTAGTREDRAAARCRRRCGPRRACRSAPGRRRRPRPAAAARVLPHRDDVVLQRARAAVVDDRAVLERDAAAVGEEPLVEGAQTAGPCRGRTRPPAGSRA